MGMYRVLRKLHFRGKVILRGVLLSGDKFTPEVYDKLQAVGAIAPVSTPPLAELPGWGRRAVRLGKIGIVTIIQLMECKEVEVGEKLHVRPDTVLEWRKEALRWLDPSMPKKC